MKFLKVLDAESTDNELVLEGYIALFGGTDLQGERFTASTDFESSYTRKNIVAIDWEHGYEPDKVENQPGTDDVLGRVDWLTTRRDEFGLLARHILDRREAYVREVIEPLARAEMLGSSSEAVPKGVQIEPDGTITRWPIKRQSLTVNPAEPRLLTEHQIQVIKSIPALKSLLDGRKTVSDKQSDKSNGDKNQMDEKQIQEMIAKAVQEALKTAGDNQPDFKTIISDTVKSVLENQDSPDIDEVVAKAIESYIDKLPEKAKSIFVVEDEADKKAKAHPYQFGFKMQAVRAKALNLDLTHEQKAILGQNESVPQDGGYLVGTDQSSELEKKMHDESVFASRAQLRTISTGANSMDFYGVKESSRATGSRYGGIRVYKVAEAGTITASSMDFYKYTLKPEKYAALVYATDEVMNDAAVLEQEINEAVPKEMSFELDNDMFRGSSAGYPQGILNANCLVTVAKETGQAAATVVAENIIKMWARRWVRGNYVWFVNQDVTPQLHQLNLPVGTGGALVYMPPGGWSVSPDGSLYGRPVIETEFNSTLGTVGDIVLADYGAYKYANVGGMKTASSMHVQFVTDQMAWRFTNRFDGQATWEAALTPFQGTNTVSPFIALATRS